MSTKTSEHDDLTREARVRALAGAQGFFYVTTGLWPIVHLRSFEAVTGRKRDKWLVKTVGLLITCIGAALLASSRSRVSKPLVLLGASTPAALAGIDIVYRAKRTIPTVYLLDAAVELGLAAAWGLCSVRPRRPVSARSRQTSDAKAG